MTEKKVFRISEADKIYEADDGKTYASWKLGKRTIKKELKKSTGRLSDAFPPEKLEDIANRARREGFIAIPDIAAILSSVDGYTDQLPELWQEYQLSIRKSFPDDISMHESRFGVWYALFDRWTRGTVAAVSGGLRPIKELPGYIDDPIKRKLVAFDGTENDPDYVMLDDLKCYFKDYLKIPLPAMLFPPAVKATSDKRSMPKPRFAIAYDEAVKLHRDYPSTDKVTARKKINIILKRQNFTPYSRTQFNRIIKDIGFSNAPRGRKSPNKKK